MKTEKELYAAILNITMKIEKQFPELAKYIVEMPVTIPNVESPKINRKIVQEYYDSLKVLVKDYVDNRPKTEN